MAIERYGSFLYGGAVVPTPDGATFHGDHGYVQYLVPSASRDTPIVMWHGALQSGKTWETTADGRDGFDHIFPAQGWPVFILDQPRRGRAGRATPQPGALTHNPTASEAGYFGNYRLGVWNAPAKPVFFPGVQFPQDGAALDQFFRQQTPNTQPEAFPSPEERAFQARTAAALLRRTGPAILFTHSHSGQYGWETAMDYPALVKAVVAFEPGQFAFPQGYAVPDIPTENDTLRVFMAPQFVTADKFAALTRIPIRIYLGDNITSTPTKTYGPELWRMVRLRARQFVAAVNAAGGDARLIELPQVGLCGNTHFPMSDLNNVAVASQVMAFLKSRGLDGRMHGYRGPGPLVAAGIP